MILTGQLGFHRSSPSLTNDRTSHLDNSTKGFGKNSSNTQLTMTSMTSPKQGSEYETWFSVDEQQQIINVLKDVNYRHERQLWCDMQSFKIDHMSLDNSTSSSVDHNSSDCQYGSFSSDEDDGITVLVSPTDHPLNDVMDSEMHLSIASDDLIEKSTSDYFEEFQNIFTTSPEKNIINTLVKECFKETHSKNPTEETSIERNVPKKEMVSDKCNNNEMLVEDVSTEHNSSKDSNDNESIANKVTPKECTNTEATKIAYSEKIERLSPSKPLSRWFESVSRPSVVESAIAQETPDGVEVPIFGPVVKVVTENNAEAATVTPSEKIQRSSPVIQMSQSFELNKGPSLVTTTAKDNSVAVLSGNSETPKSFGIPKFGSVIEMKQISLPTRLQISSSDQIVLTDYHRRKIQKQKYDFDCKYTNACNFKPYKPNPHPQNNFPVSQMWKSIRSVYDSAQPSVHSINDYKNFILNLKSNSNKSFNKVPHVPVKYFQTYEHRGRGYRQVFEIPAEKGPVLPLKNSRVSSHRLPETGNMVQSDSCLLRNFGLPQTDYEKSSMSETHLQVKSSKDLDRLYKRISLEELFSSGDPDKPFKSSKMMNIPPFRSNVKLGPASSSFVTPTDHLKHILKIGTDGTQVSATEERTNFKFQVPFPNKIEKTRISTGCQTEATDDRSWKKSETSQEVRSNSVTSATKAPVVESNDKMKVTVNVNGKDDQKSDFRGISAQNTDNSVEFREENSKAQVEDDSSAKKSAEEPIGVRQKDEEKSLNKKGSRKKGKASRNKTKGELKNDAEISCCEKCRQNMDIMNFSENEMQFDIGKQSGAGADAYSMKKQPQMKAFEEPEKTQLTQDKEVEKEMAKVQVKAVLLDPKRSKPITAEDIRIKNSYRAKKTKTIYKDVFKEFCRPNDFGTSSTNANCAIQEHKILPGSKPFNFYPVKKSSSDTSQSFKSLKSDYNSLLRYKMQRPKKHFRRFEKYNTSEDESTVNIHPINADDIQCKSSQEFRYKDEKTGVCDHPSSLHSDKHLGSNKDQNIHTKCNNLCVPQHPKKDESTAMQTGREVCTEKVQYQDKDALDAKNVYEDLTAMSPLGTSLKYHLKPAFSKPNCINENLSSIDGKISSPKVRERFVHNVNAPIQEKWSGLMDPKETVKNKSEIAITG